MTEVPQVSTSIKRSGYIIEIEGMGVSVTFYPYDKDRTYNAILAKCKVLGHDLTSDIENHEVRYDRHNIDIQLTEIYREYYDELEDKRIKDEDQLLIIAYSQIKQKFKDQNGKCYAVTVEDNQNEIISLDSEEFDGFLLRIFHEGEKKLISKDKRNNVKTLLKAHTTEIRTLYKRIAKIGDAIYYNLNNEQSQSVKIAKEGWKIIDNPLLFWPSDLNTEQTPPDRDYDRNRRYVREIIDKSTIKHQHQKLIDEVYTLSLFIPDIAHPMAIPIGPAGSGKTVHFRVKKLIVDPMNNFDALVQKLPKDEKDRRVTIYDNFLSFFDNESMLSYYEMDELCMWVTGYSKTIRILHTTDERRTYSGKRSIGINGINIPVSNSDIMSRCFVTEHAPLVSAAYSKDSKDSKAEKIIERESKYLTNTKQIVPPILGYIFDTLVKALQTFDEVDAEMKPTDRLADWTVWGETIARALGYDKNEFLDAWNLNKETQSYAVIRNNSFAILLIKYAFNKRHETEFSIEPEDLLKNLRSFAEEIDVDYYADKGLPKNSVWLSRKLNMIKQDLKIAGLVIDETKSDERLIRIRKDINTYKRQQLKQKKLEDLEDRDY